MRLLIVSWYFPPSNTIASVRIGKMAEHLTALGNEVTVLAPEDPPYRATLSCSISAEQVYRAPWYNMMAPPKALLKFVRRVGDLFKRRQTNQSSDAENAKPEPQEFEAWASRRKKFSWGRFYAHLVCFPDERVGWLFHARRQGKKILAEREIDIIFASGPPFSVLLIGYLLSRSSGRPLVIEFRDRWSDDPYNPPPKWRHAMERWLERKIVNHAVGISTVSAPWAETYRQRFGKPTIVVLNGYDAEDFEGVGNGGWPDPNTLRIVYTGGIYPGKRDPTPLFQAVAQDDELRQSVRFSFYGTIPAVIWPIVRRECVEEQFELHGYLDRPDVLEQQGTGDVLLLMQWDNPLEQGNVPGKLSEYFGARRPILVLGLANGVPATLVQERDAGFCSTDPEVIRAGLKAWLVEKKRIGGIPPLPESARTGLSRAAQVEDLHRFLQDRFEEAR